MERADIAILIFDYSASGVVGNALRIAGAASAGGLVTEIWAVQDIGTMRNALPTGVRSVAVGQNIGLNYSRKERRVAALGSVAALAAAITERKPRMLLSAGNHFHETAVRARKAASIHVPLIGRVSNALPRFSWVPPMLPISIWKRVAARRRFLAMDHLVTVSHALRRGLQTKLLIDGARISVIPNGIDIEAIARAAAAPLEHPWFHPGQPPVIVGVGRLVAQKNFEALIRAFGQLREITAARLILLGEGPERPALEQLIGRLGLSEDVCLAGYVDNPAAYLARASLFVLPSRWEGMSNALLEALSVGCPVLATRCDGSLETLGGELSHLLVPVDDPRGLAPKMLQVLRAPPESKVLQQRATQFSLDESLADYVKLFEARLALSDGEPQATERRPREAFEVQSRNSASGMGRENT